MVAIFGFVNRAQELNQILATTQEEFGLQSHSKKAIEKTKAHEKSSFHVRASEALQITSREGSIMHQLQRAGVLQREKNKAAIKSLVQCTHFLTRTTLPTLLIYQM